MKIKRIQFQSLIRGVFPTFLLVAMILSFGRPATHPVTAQMPTPTPGDKIVGGSTATPGQYPWQVALVDSSTNNLLNGQFCGGSVISNQWILTAAHCVTYSNGTAISPSFVDIVAGVHNLAAPAVGYQRRNITNIIVHPSYNPVTDDYDAALLRVASPLTLGGSGATAVAAIPLVSDAIGDLVGVNATITGWGRTESTPMFPAELQEVTVPVVSNVTCNTSYSGVITSNMLCAGLDLGGKDSCQGDSGGPLVVDVGGQWQLAGIVSWGIGCADPNYYGVYTRVSNIVSWVNSSIYVFADVPIGHWARPYIESMYQNGYTGGCSTSPLLFCPDSVMSRAESAVFLLRSTYGTTYVPPVEPWLTFGDDFSQGLWGRPWVQGLYDAGLTAGCSTSPMLFCPWEKTTRAQLAVFGMRMLIDASYLPSAGPNTGTVFADVSASDWFVSWAEEAYINGIIESCGMSSGLPLFCPDSLVTRAEASFTIAKAKNLVP
jgi:hypothetical protein